MNIINDFKEWEKEKEELRETEDSIRRSIKLSHKEKLSGDRGYYVKGRVLRHSFTAGCQEKGWYSGWSIGVLSGVSFGEEYKLIVRTVESYLNKEYTLNRIKKEIKKWVK